ncbi:hypothetical protein DM860_010695 [Cuscuta australis]|uniref:Uncharacterized protein n=1 Tax=Cuscuta australis TaxID=267555 RepID=A0A328DZL7_9ASTE|nr:hypothetical protein DM860_005538 [Cuscuta australis]RAL51184.1 hypothetical protein DM860_005540 [Cuscuta australis]RAL51193.1 hypothetical protein DM860_010695 [Cuscuta australis]
MLRISSMSVISRRPKIFPVLHRGQHKDAFKSAPPIITPPITTPTDPTAVPESPFVPDFDADPPIRPGDDDHLNQTRATLSGDETTPRGPPEAPHQPASP